MAKKIIFIVEKKKKETLKSTTFFLRPNQNWHYRAGQYIILQVVINGKKYNRSYSLCSSPSLDEFPAITVKRVKDGMVSNYLNSYIDAGSKLEVWGAYGQFVLPESFLSPLIFIGGGSGLVPIHSLIKEALALSCRQPIFLLSSNRKERNILYKKEWEQIAKKSSNFSFMHTLTKPYQTWEGNKGRIDNSLLISQLEDKFDLQKLLFYICVPDGLSIMVRQWLLSKNVAPYRIIEESFSSTVSPKPHIDEEEKDFTLKLTRQKKTKLSFPINSKTTILQVLLDKDIDIPYSCMDGVCNSCKLFCSSGKTSMEEENGLSKEEKKQGYILSCIAFPKSDVSVELPDEDYTLE